MNGVDKGALMKLVNERKSAVASDVVADTHTTKAKPLRNSGAVQDDDRDELLHEFVPTFERMIEDDCGGAESKSADRWDMAVCGICGHRGCFRYYPDTGTYHCFSDNHPSPSGGTSIDYLMQMRGMSTAEAFAYVRDRLGRENGNARNMGTIKKHAVPAVKCDAELVPYQSEMVERMKEIGASTNYTRDGLGFSRMFVKLYGDRYRYDIKHKSWIAYDGIIWNPQAGDMLAKRAVKDFSDAALQYAAQLQKNDANKPFMSYALKLGNIHVREDILHDAQDQLYTTPDAFDNDDDLLNTPNGTIDLATFEMRPHEPDDFITKVTRAEYVPGLRSELWESTVAEVMMHDRDKIEFLQKWLGYCMTGDASLEKACMFHGLSTRNGKSTIIETIAEMLGGNGGYSCSIDPESLAVKNNPNSGGASADIARIRGCRFLPSSEVQKHMRLDGAKLKQLTGNDTIIARHLYTEPEQFRCTGKLTINCNHLPIINDDTLFASGRILVLPFERHFTEDEQDLKLKEKLKSPENLSGVLNWCIDGLRMVRGDGLKPPECVVDSTIEYRSSSDIVGQFVSDKLVAESGSVLRGGDVYSMYVEWVTANGYGTPGKQNFLDELRAHSMLFKTGTIDGKTVRNVVKGYRERRAYDDD